MTDAPTYQRPGKLTAICIVSFVLCLFALLTAVTSISGGMGATNPFSQMAEMGQPDDVVRVQRAMTAEIQAATKEWAHWYVVIVVLNLALTGLLASGAIMSLRMKRPGDQLLTVGFAVGIAAELVGVFPTVSVQRTTMEVLDRWMPGLLAETAANPAVDQTVSAIMRVSIVAGLAMTGVFVVAKLGFYVWGMRVLRHREVRERFAAHARS